MWSKVFPLMWCVHMFASPSKKQFAITGASYIRTFSTRSFISEQGDVKQKENSDIGQNLISDHMSKKLFLIVISLNLIPMLLSLCPLARSIALFSIIVKYLIHLYCWLKWNNHFILFPSFFRAHSLLLHSISFHTQWKIELDIAMSVQSGTHFIMMCT